MSPTNLNPVRSNLAVVGRESGRVNIGAVSFNEPCAPLLFRKRAVAVVSEENDSLPAPGTAKFMRPTGLKPIECLSARFGLNGTRLLPDVRKYRFHERARFRYEHEGVARSLARFHLSLLDIDTFLIWLLYSETAISPIFPPKRSNFPPRALIYREKREICDTRVHRYRRRRAYRPP